MRNKNLITGAILIVLGGAFLFIAADIFDGQGVRFDVEHMPQEIATPRPHLLNNFAVRLLFARRIIGFLFLNTIPHMSQPRRHA